MTKVISISTVLLGLSASNAFAHGDHSGAVLQVLAHMLTEPDHLAMLSVGGVIAGIAIYRFSRRLV